MACHAVYHVLRSIAAVQLIGHAGKVHGFQKAGVWTWNRHKEGLCT